MRPLRVLRRAQRDLAEVQGYLETDAPDQVDEVMEQLLTAIDRLARFAELGPVCRDRGLRARGFRALSVGRYRIFYRILRAQVRVYRVLHHRRAYDELL